METSADPRANFLIKNLLEGLFWLILLLSGFLLLQQHARPLLQEALSARHKAISILFPVFRVSELFFGIIPPELFLMVGITLNISECGYVINLALYSFISHFCGVIAYFVVHFFSGTQMVDAIRRKFLVQIEPRFREFGTYIIIAGALTPAPFSATCLVAGSVKVPLKEFPIASSYRFVRFVVYGWIARSFQVGFNRRYA